MERDRSSDLLVLPVRLPRPRHVMTMVAVWLVAGWTTFVLVDLFNVFGSRDVLFELLDRWPYAFTTIFDDGGPTEWLQWIALGGVVALAAVASSLQMRDGRRDAAGFWLLLSVGALLMLMEDAGNVRHTVRAWAARLGGRTADLAAEMAVYGLIVAVPLYAVVRYRRYFFEAVEPRRFLLGAAAAYAVAGGASATRHFWYVPFGDWLTEVVLGGRLPPFPADVHSHPVGFFLLDHLFEESVELIGASLFLCAALACVRGFEKAGANAVVTPRKETGG